MCSLCQTARRTRDTPVIAKNPRGRMAAVARYPDSTKTSLEQRLRSRARERWPQIASLHIRHHGTFSYIDATLTDATTPLNCAACAMSAPPANGSSPSTAPATTTMTNRSSSPASPSAPAKTPRHRLRPLHERPHRLDQTPDELTGETT
jgi:hypothetical protein